MKLGPYFFLRGDLMSLSRLYEVFRTRDTLPVEIEEIAAAMCDLGFQDEISFRPVPMNTAELYGVIYQYTDHGAVYGQPRLATIIVYPENIGVEEARVVSCKELLHVIDRAIEKVNSCDRLSDVVENLVGKRADGPTVGAFIAAQDEMTLFRCIPLLFPAAAREVARKMLADGTRTMEQIAEWAALPNGLVAFAMRDDWPEYEKRIYPDK